MGWAVRAVCAAILLLGVSAGTAVAAERGPARSVAADSRAGQPQAVASCGKTIWKSRTMDAKKVRKFVKIFKNTVKAGKDIGTAFGVASSGTGIGTLPGVAITIVAKFGGDFVIDFVLKKLTASLKTYKRVGIKVGFKCVPPRPTVGFHGPRK